MDHCAEVKGTYTLRRYYLEQYHMENTTSYSDFNLEDLGTMVAGVILNGQLYQSYLNTNPFG
jgi:hypothetical protein